VFGWFVSKRTCAAAADGAAAAAVATVTQRSRQKSPARGRSRGLPYRPCPYPRTPNPSPPYPKLQTLNPFQHITQGGKIGKTKRGDKLDALLARNDVSGRGLRTIYDEYNDEEVVLSKEELKMILRIRKGQFPHVEVGSGWRVIDWFNLVCVGGGARPFSGN
jgi:hypothetical protein